MSLFFCQFLSAVGVFKKDCRHILRSCRLSVKPLGRPLKWWILLPTSCTLHDQCSSKTLIYTRTPVHVQSFLLSVIISQVKLKRVMCFLTPCSGFNQVTEPSHVVMDTNTFTENCMLVPETDVRFQSFQLFYFDGACMYNKWQFF